MIVYSQKRDRTFCKILLELSLNRFVVATAILYDFVIRLCNNIAS